MDFLWIVSVLLSSCGTYFSRVWNVLIKASRNLRRKFCIPLSPSLEAFKYKFRQAVISSPAKTEHDQLEVLKGIGNLSTVVEQQKLQNTDNIDL